MTERSHSVGIVAAVLLVVFHPHDVNGGFDAIAPVAAPAATPAGAALDRAIVLAQGPTRHDRIDMPADIDDERAESIYRAISESMRRSYGAIDPDAYRYQDWRRVNHVPYRSRPHGDRFVNHYANETAAAYGTENAGVFPEGAMIAKDSFAVTADGTILTGPLFLMEKMATGWNRSTRDWRFAIIEPQGGLAGLTGGVKPANVAFCGDCHIRSGHDGTFGVPGRFR